MVIRGGRFGGKLCEAFLPNNSWGPSSIKERRDWQVVKIMTMLITMMLMTMMMMTKMMTMMMIRMMTMMTKNFQVYSETHSKLEFLPSKLRSRLEKDSAPDQLPK